MNRMQADAGEQARSTMSDDDPPLEMKIWVSSRVCFVSIPFEDNVAELLIGPWKEG